MWLNFRYLSILRQILSTLFLKTCERACLPANSLKSTTVFFHTFPYSQTPSNKTIISPLHDQRVVYGHEFKITPNNFHTNKNEKKKRSRSPWDKETRIGPIPETRHEMFRQWLTAPLALPSPTRSCGGPRKIAIYFSGGRV